MPEPGPLDILISLLERRAPLLLAGLLDRILPEEGFSEFLDLIGELLPDHRTEILAGDTADARIMLFASHFRDAYFPLPWFEDMWGEYSLQDLVSAIPIQACGIDYEDWHEMPEGERPGRQLMAALIESPWDSGTDEGSRIPILEVCSEYVPQALLERVPAGGYRPGQLHRLLDGTAHSALALFGDVAWHQTGAIFLDIDDEEFNTATWDLETVTELTEHWLRTQSITDQTFEMEQWLGTNPVERFTELLDFIDARQKILEVSE